MFIRKHILFLGLFLPGLLFSCKPRKTKPVIEEKPEIGLSLEINTPLFIPDKNTQDALICRIHNNSGQTIALGLDSLFSFFSLFGQGESQKYPMLLRYNMSAEYNSGDMRYIDPGNSDIIFRSPMNQLFFNQMRFNPGENGWMWQSLQSQKADYSPVHDYDALQKKASFWCEVRYKGKLYRSNTVSCEVRSAN